MPLIYSMMLNIWGLLDLLTIFGALQLVAVLRLCVVFTDAYSKYIHCHLWISIGIGCIPFHVKFEGSLSISVFRNKATLSKKFGAQNR
jgi:hypothetical protein